MGLESAAVKNRQINGIYAVVYVVAKFRPVVKTILMTITILH